MRSQEPDKQHKPVYILPPKLLRWEATTATIGDDLAALTDTIIHDLGRRNYNGSPVGKAWDLRLANFEITGERGNWKAVYRDMNPWTGQHFVTVAESAKTVVEAKRLCEDYAANLVRSGRRN